MDDKNFTQQTEKEVTAWQILGWTAPFVALFGAVICVLTYEHLLLWYIGLVITIFLSVCVAWWWWAIAKIVRIVRLLADTTKNFDDVKEELRKLKQDVDNRKRRKQE